MKTAPWPSLVLSIYATTRGFAFALFEGPISPIDWGVKDTRGWNRNAQCLEAVSKLIEMHQPDVIVIEDCAVAGSRRSDRIRRLYRAIDVRARHQAIETYRYSRTLVRETFLKLGAFTKDEIAEAIGKHIPAFEHRRPPIRRAWMSEDPRMGLFDATALVVTFFHFKAASDFPPFAGTS